MRNRILVFYGSYRSDRMGIRLALFVVERLRRRGDDVELIDAKAINLPMLDRMYKEYPKGEAPEPLERLAGKIRDADGFVLITGEYNWGVQPGLKNLTDHFLEEWFWRPAAIASYSAGRFSGARAANRLARHTFRDGYGGGLEHDRRRSYRTDLVDRRRTRWGGGPGA
jgi:NAD(P)H-dependent FMN reductase